MTLRKRDRGSEIQAAIRQVLYRDWDPIGVCDAAPEDEYDTYIRGVYRILASSRSEDALIEYLAARESETMGLEPQSADRLRVVARKLLALDVSS